MAPSLIRNIGGMDEWALGWLWHEEVEGLLHGLVIVSPPYLVKSPQVK